jgi:hypothetical protein
MKKILALVLLIASVIVLAIGLLVASKNIFNIGKIKALGVEIFTDVECTVPLHTIDWGVVDAGSSVHKIAYIRNNGTTAEVLSLSTVNWLPNETQTYLMVEWNCTGFVLEADSVVAADIVLSVNPSVHDITNFSFDIIITGTEQ